MSKVVILKAERYERNLLSKKIYEIFEYFGGLDEIIPSNAKVLLKPNLLSPSLPSKCITTHPEFVRAVIEVVKNRTSRVFLGDSPGGYVNYREVLEKTGMLAVAEETKVEVVKFEKPRIVEGIPIAEEVFESDVIISLPKFKTHCLTIITAGIKNCFGCIPGLFKSEIHKENPRAIELSRILVKAYRIVNPRFTILDAIWSMEGDGPSQGLPRNTGLILASLDAVSLDSILSYLIGLNPLQVPTNRIAYTEGIGLSNLEDIEIASEFELDKFKIDNFKFPKISLLDKLPRRLISLGGKFIRFYPKVIQAKCIKCGTCIRSCPVEAMSMKDGAVEINPRRCILCLCCHELCPENAIEIKRSYLAKKLGI